MKKNLGKGTTKSPQNLGKKRGDPYVLLHILMYHVVIYDISNFKIHFITRPIAPEPP